MQCRVGPLSNVMFESGHIFLIDGKHFVDHVPDFL